MKKIISPYRLVILLHLTGLAALSLMRLALYCAGHSFLSQTSHGQVLLQSIAFLRGIWFDNVIMCYVTALPLLLTTICSLFAYNGRWLHRFTKGWMLCFTLLATFISAANIPYFLYFFKNINSSIWNWAEYGATTIGMLLGEPSYYPPTLGALAMAVVLYLLTKRLHAGTSVHRWLSPAVGLLLCGACVFGIRGRMGYNPIKVSAAYYCQDAFLNQLGINPAFNLLTSTLDDRRPENRELHLMTEGEALAQAEHYLGREINPQNCLVDNIVPTEKKRNVVLILMESMSYDLLGHGQTPFLDSLATQSIQFTHCYSAGNHTNHGIFSTLYSVPALMFRNLMKGSNTPVYQGLPTTMSASGYKTLFFMTHESQYDNMNAFLRTNGYQQIYSQENYPSERIVNSFGVQDDFLFHFAIDKLNSQTDNFFATLLTISNHPPFIVPEWFTPRSEAKELQIVEYADESLRQFFAEARKQSWYSNTIFVLLGDHGKLLGEPENEMPECCNHIPLLFFTPGGEAEVRQQWATQMDVQPTLLNMLGVRSEQHHFGIDLMHQTRPFAIYSADNVIGARGGDRLYIYNPTTEQEFMYHGGELQQSPDSTFLQMKDYLFSNMQSAQSVIRHHAH